MSELADDPFVEARKIGMKVVLPQDDELFIDIDSDEDLNHFFAMCDLLDKIQVPREEAIITPSRSPDHYHIRMKLKPGWKHGSRIVVNGEARIAFQAAMGSDRKRELLSMLRIYLALDRPPTVFFEEE